MSLAENDQAGAGADLVAMNSSFTASRGSGGPSAGRNRSLLKFAVKSGKRGGRLPMQLVEQHVIRKALPDAYGKGIAGAALHPVRLPVRTKRVA